MTLEVLKAGDPALRKLARALSEEEIKSDFIQQLILNMRDFMHESRGCGLAAPQIGKSIQLVIIEDRMLSAQTMPPELIAMQDRHPVPFHVLVNPRIVKQDGELVEFFEGCLSVPEFCALVPRHSNVRVECVNEKGDSKVIEAKGWYARILQHEIDHCYGKLYVDRMVPGSLMTSENQKRYWQDIPFQDVRSTLRNMSRLEVRSQI